MKKYYRKRFENLIAKVSNLPNDYVSDSSELELTSLELAKLGDQVYDIKEPCNCKDDEKEGLIVFYGSSNIAYMKVVCCPQCARRTRGLGVDDHIIVRAASRRSEDKLLDKRL